MVVKTSFSSDVRFRFNKSNRSEVNPGRYGEYGELRWVGVCSAKSFRTSCILLSDAAPASSSGVGGVDPTSTTSFHLGVGISCGFNNGQTQTTLENKKPSRRHKSHRKCARLLRRHANPQLTLVNSFETRRTISGSRVLS
jgi:hypothetical protein